MGTVSELAPTAVEDDEIVFRLERPRARARRRASVWFDVELGRRARDGRGRRRLGAAARRCPDLDCLEYLFDVDGALVPDPGNPDQVEGAFGPHSWLAMPGLPATGLARRGRPSRASGTADRRRRRRRGVGAGRSRGPAAAAAGPRRRRDGRVRRRGPLRRHPAADAGRRCSARATTATSGTPPTRRTPPRWSTRWCRRSPTPSRRRTGRCCSARASARSRRCTPPGPRRGTFGGLMLQSGSFFTPALDPQESGYAHFDQVTGFVATVLAAQQAAPRAPEVTMTCGTAEENLANNLALRDHLREVGLPCRWGEVRQGHTWTCWRDSLAPAPRRPARRGPGRRDGAPPGRARRPRLRPVRHGDPLRPLGPAGPGLPERAGRAWDYENNGMVGAVADLIDAGRCKLYCVDSFDEQTWSDSSIPLEERARRHGAYASWILDQRGALRSARTAPAPATPSSPAARWAPTTRCSSR